MKSTQNASVPFMSPTPEDWALFLRDFGELHLLKVILQRRVSELESLLALRGSDGTGDGVPLSEGLGVKSRGQPTEDP